MTESAKQRQANALGAAREYYRLARETLDLPPGGDPQRAAAQALLGILRCQIELIDGQWDAPCDCFAAMPDPKPEDWGQAIFKGGQ